MWNGILFDFSRFAIVVYCPTIIWFRLTFRVECHALQRFWFGYQVDRFGDYMEPLYPENFTKEELDERAKFSYKAERPGIREPYETPFGPGSLFAIRADEFWRLGGYDEGELMLYM